MAVVVVVAVVLGTILGKVNLKRLTINCTIKP